MTAKKHLKERIRERQEKTGESYSVARAHVLTQREPVIEEVLMEDVTSLARGHGFTCRAFATEELWRGEPGWGPAAARLDEVFRRLRDLLEALADDPAAQRMCLALLRERPRPLPIPRGLGDFIEMRRFLAGVRGGARGVAAHGRAAAYDIPLGSTSVTLLALVFPASPGAPESSTLFVGEIGDLMRSLLAGGGDPSWSQPLLGLGGGRGVP